MTKSELRKARKAARANNQPLEGILALDRDKENESFSETARGYQARERWARRYNDLNGAPESDYDQ